MDNSGKWNYTPHENPCLDIPAPEMMDKTSLIQFVGNITSKDIEDGGVLIFRINERAYPRAVLKRVAESVKQAVQDTFNGQVKALILPDTVSVEMIPRVLEREQDESV